MNKKTILVILCIVAHHACNTEQPKGPWRNDPLSFSNSISQNIEREMETCKIDISKDVLDLCDVTIHHKSTASYFDYKQAICVTLHDSVQRLCRLTKSAKIQLEQTNPTVKNVGALCSEMRSVLDNSLNATKVSERNEWITALKDKLSDDEMCKDACIEVGEIINPVCSTLLQINAHLVSEKHNLLENSSGAEKTSTNTKQDVQKAASDQNHKEPKVAAENVSLDVHPDKSVNDQNGKVSPLQNGDNTKELPITKETSVKNEPESVSSISKIENKEGIEISKKVAKHKSAAKNHINVTTIPEYINKQTSNIQKPNNDQATDNAHATNNDHATDNAHATNNDHEKNNKIKNNDHATGDDHARNNAPSLDIAEMIREPTVNKVPPVNTVATDEEPALSKSSTDMKEIDKNPEKNKQFSISEDTSGKMNEPPPKSDGNKATNVDKPPTNTEETKKGPEIEPVVDVPKDKNSDVKIENFPEVPKDSKTQESKIATDSSTKKTSVSSMDDVIEQAESPDTESEIIGKDHPIFDGNNFNDETGEQNMGENQEIDLDGNLASVDDEDTDTGIITQKINTLPEIDDGMISSAEKGPYVRDKFVNAEDPHFFAYFLTMVVICIVGYLVYHNKQKILALALEGRSRRSSRRRPNTSGYRKLDSNLEEAVTSACSTSVTHVIY